MKNTAYSKKISQFKNLSGTINNKLADGTWNCLTEPERHRMTSRLRRLFEMVRNILGACEIKKILAAAAVLLCITSAKAQTFAPPVSNPFGIASLDSVIIPTFADIDNDGDQDLFVLESYGDVLFFRNTGTAAAPAFAAAQANPFNMSLVANTQKIDFADLDGDGDLDIIGGEYYGNLRYYQNAGTATIPYFSASALFPFGLAAVSQVAFPAFVDIDNDGDQDLLVVAYYGSMPFFLNTGTATAPGFAAQVQNPYGIDSSDEAGSPDFADLDNDGDPDLMVGDYYYNDLLYYMNTGTASSPSFAAPQYNPFGITPPCESPIPVFVDIDNDGDMDLFLGSVYSGLEIFFYENTTYMPGIKTNNDIATAELFPVPAHGQIIIRCRNFSGERTIKMIDALGKVVKQLQTTENETLIETGDLSPGIYIVEIADKAAVIRKKAVIN